MRRNVKPFTINLDSEVDSDAEDSIMEGWESDRTVTENNATIVQESFEFRKFLQKFTKLHNFTEFYITLHNFTQFYITLHNFT